MLQKNLIVSRDAFLSVSGHQLEYFDRLVENVIVFYRHFCLRTVLEYGFGLFEVLPRHNVW